MNKKLLLQIAFLIFLVVGTIVIVRQHQKRPYIKNNGLVFGTFYHITYQADANLQVEIEKVLQEIDLEFSMFNDSSTVSRINRGEKPSLSPTFVKVFNLAKDINNKTGEAFDITVAPLVNAWGFGVKNEQLPDSTQVDSLRQMVGMKDLQITSSNVWQNNGPMRQLDFSAIAKGYGCDVVGRLLKHQGCVNYMIEIGGEVVCQGKNPDGEAWHIGINKPSEEDSRDLQAVIEIKGKALATSGNYRRFYYQDGQRRAHTIDPRTGFPVDHSLLSATVIANDCATADAFATAFMVVGLERAIELVKENHLKAYLIYTDENDAYAVWENL